MAEQRRREYLLVVVYAMGIGLGTVAALWMRDDLVETVGIYQSFFKENFSQLSMNHWDYLIYIMQQRFWSMGLLLVFSMTAFAYPCLCAFSFYYGFCMAGMVVVATVSRGMMGFLFFFVSVMPHYILYSVSVFVLVYMICRVRYYSGGQKIQNLILSLVLFLAGIFLEVYCNPILMKGMMQIWG